MLSKQWMDGWMDGWMDEWMDGWTGPEFTNNPIKIRMDGWMDGWMDGVMNGLALSLQTIRSRFEWMDG